jgi:hypothetical protein
VRHLLFDFGGPLLRLPFEMRAETAGMGVFFDLGDPDGSFDRIRLALESP